MASDGKIQVGPDSTGKIVDTTELTRADGTLVERQRMVLADDTDPSVTLSLKNRAMPTTSEEILKEILVELREMKFLLSGLNAPNRR